VGLAIAVWAAGVAGAQREEHGRKYKPEPPTAHIVVTVEKGFNSKPLPNAAVVFHAVRNGKNDGNLEVKTDPDGKAIIDVIEIGSQVNVQVIATGFATSATELNVDGPSKALLVKLQRPRAQVSEFEDTDGEAAQVKPGVQARVMPKRATKPPSPAMPPPSPGTPAPSSPPAANPSAQTGTPQ
jgi:hypothetical protein